MFSFYTSAFKSIKPQNWKVIGFTVISAIMLLILLIPSAFLIGSAITNYHVQEQMQSQLGGGGSNVSNMLPVFASIIIVALVWILLGYPVFSSLVYMISKATRGETVNIRDIFSTFFKGRYAKSLLMGLISSIIFVIAYAIYKLIMRLYIMLASSIINHFASSLQNVSNPNNILTTIQIVNSVISGLVLSIVMIIAFMIIINMTASFVNDVERSAGTHIKNGFKGIKNGHKTWFKFFIGTVLIWLISIIVLNVLIPLISLSLHSMSQRVASIILIVLIIIGLIISIILLYIIFVAMVHYFNRNGKKPEKSTKA